MNWKGWVLILIGVMLLMSGAFSGGGSGILSLVFAGGKGSDMQNKPVWHEERITVSTPAWLNAGTFGGSVSVSSHERDEILVRIHVRSNGRWLGAGDDAPVEITITDAPDGVEITAEQKRTGLFRSVSNVSVSYDILVPTETEVRAKTSGGSVSAYGIARNVSLITSGGPVTAERITGDVLARTSGGSVTVRDVTGDLTARTSGGGIRISNASGKISARTSGGSVRLEDVAGAIEARTSGGSIDARITQLQDHLTLHTSGGSINARLPRETGMDIRASGTSVSANLEDLSGNIAQRSIDGTVLDGGIPVSLRTTGGSVRISH
jgi:hypothetical protein